MRQLTKRLLTVTLKLMKGEKLILIIAGIVTIALIAVLVLLGVNENKPTAKPDTSVEEEMINPDEEAMPAKPELIQVPFDYTVKTVTTTEIILDGEKGELLLPQDVSKVKVYFRTADGDTRAELSDVKEGAKAQLEIIPGQSATLYLVQ